MISYVLVVAAIVMATFASHTQAGQDVSQVLGMAPDSQHKHLAPGTLQAIQGLGRVVLGAKHSALPDADEIALFNELKALSSTLDQATFATKKPSPITLKNDDAKPRMESASASDNNSDRMLQTRLVSLREGHKRVSTGTREKKHDMRAQRASVLAAKAAEIDDVLKSALNSPKEQRVEKLSVVRERLRLKNLDEQLADIKQTTGIEAPKPTPTFTTIVRHR